MDGVGRSQPNIHTQGAMRAEKSVSSSNQLNEAFKSSYDAYTRLDIYKQLLGLQRGHRSGRQSQLEDIEDQTSRYAEQVEQQIRDTQEAIEQSNHYGDPLYGINPGRIRRTVRRLTRNHPELAQQITDQAKQLKRDSAIYHARASAVYDKTGEKPIKDPDVRHAWLQVTKDVINLKASLIKANALDYQDVMTTVNTLKKHLGY